MQKKKESKKSKKKNWILVTVIYICVFKNKRSSSTGTGYVFFIA